MKPFYFLLWFIGFMVSTGVFVPIIIEHWHVWNCWLLIVMLGLQALVVIGAFTAWVFRGHRNPKMKIVYLNPNLQAK